MKPADEIKKFFKNAGLNTNPNTDEAVFDQMLTAHKKTAETKSADIKPNIWRTIMKGKMAKLAIAAVIIIGVLIGINQLGVPIDGTSVAWADVQTAFINRPWVHVKYDNGSEEWHNLHEGKVFIKDENNSGLCKVNDLVSGTRYLYFTGFDNIYENTFKSVYKNGKALNWQPKTAWETIVGPLDRLRSDIEKHSDILNDKECVRFDRYFTDAFDQRILIQQLWADTATQLPVHIRKRLTATAQQQQNREFITGDFDFPQTGPTTIYDLGVPDHLKIVNARKQRESTSFEVGEIIEDSAKASENFPSQYLSIIWESENSYGEVAVIYRNGHKINVSRYVYDKMSPMKISDSHLTADKVLRWTQTQEPSTVFIFDEEKEYSRRNAASFGHSSNKQPQVYVRRSCTKSIQHLQLWYRLGYRFWPHVGWTRNRHTEIITDHPEAPEGSIVLSTGDNYFFIDTEKDYLCLGKIMMKIQDDQTHKRRETWWSDFSQLPTGHWYPKKEHFTSFPDPEKGTSGHEQYWNIDIQLLEEEEFPLDIFNGEKLLEGAEIKTY